MHGYKNSTELTIEDLELDDWLPCETATPRDKSRVPLFCFASKSKENIRRALERKKWAVSPVLGATRKGWITRARKMKAGSTRGLLYCSETHSFTVPFVVASEVDASATVTDIWDGEWILPFDICPLGDLTRQLHMHQAEALWPFLRTLCERNGSVSAAMNLTGIATFVPTEILEEDWFRIVFDLGGAKCGHLQST